MRIVFICKQKGSKTPFVNTAIFRKNDKEFVIDRDTTYYEYDEKSSVLTMEWRGCYLWDGEKQDYNVTKDTFIYTYLDHLELEEDAPEDYSLECLACNVDGKDLVVKRTVRKGKETC